MGCFSSSEIIFPTVWHDVAGFLANVRGRRVHSWHDYAASRGKIFPDGLEV